MVGLPLGQPRQHHVPETCSPPQSRWLKAPGETQGHPGGFWSQRQRGSEAHYSPTAKEKLGGSNNVTKSVQLPSSSWHRDNLCCAGRSKDRICTHCGAATPDTPPRLSIPLLSPLSSATFASKPSVPPSITRLERKARGRRSPGADSLAGRCRSWNAPRAPGDTIFHSALPLQDPK